MNLGRRTATLAAAAGLALALAACSEKISTGPAGGSAPPPPVRGGGVEGDAGAAAAPVAKMEFNESDFVENDRNRDPFRSFAAAFAPDQSRRVARNQRVVILPEYALDELRLVAIVTGGEYPRAMLVDPLGKGWVIKRGDFVGRPELVHTGGANGAEYQLNWRVDKVREGDVVLTREDPAQPGIPPASRVLTMHPESERRASLENN